MTLFHSEHRMMRMGGWREWEDCEEKGMRMWVFVYLVVSVAAGDGTIGTRNGYLMGG